MSGRPEDWVLDGGQLDHEKLAVLARDCPDLAIVFETLGSGAADHPLVCKLEDLNCEVVAVDASQSPTDIHTMVSTCLESVFEAQEVAGEEAVTEPIVENDATTRTAEGEVMVAAKKAVDTEGACQRLIESLQQAPLVDFGGLHSLPQVTLHSLAERGITSPTPIQAAALPAIRTGGHAILHAETGSGKTLAYLLPLIERLAKGERAGTTSKLSAEPWSVVIALPTRELALQTLREVERVLPGSTAGSNPLVAYASSAPPSPTPVKGCSGGNEQERVVGSVQAPIVVGSAKTLADMVLRRPIGSEVRRPKSKGGDPGHVKQGQAGLGKERQKQQTQQQMEEVKEQCDAFIQVLVLDEVDRLVRVAGKYATLKDKGKGSRHLRPAERLVAGARGRNKHLQVVACSATVGRPLKRHLGGLLDPENVKGAMKVVRAEEVEEGTRAVGIPSTIQHRYVPCRTSAFEEKLETLRLALAVHQPRAPLVFLPRSEKVDTTVSRLQAMGFPRTTALHRALGFSMSSVETLLDQFDNKDIKQERQDGQLPILVASEDSARGLHLEGVDMVFVLSRPRSPDEYLHLAGRTGRQGASGIVVSIVPFGEAAAIRGWAKQLKFTLTKDELMDVEQ